MYRRKYAVNKRLFLAIISFVMFFQLSISFAAKMYYQPARVYMYDDYFSPSTITINAGQRVTWINVGHNRHTVTSDSGLFNSGRINPGGTISYTFYRPGTYYYKCTLHTILFFGMKGKVIVR